MGRVRERDVEAPPARERAGARGAASPSPAPSRAARHRRGADRRPCAASPASSRSSSVCAKSRAVIDTSCPRSSSSATSGRKKTTCGEFVTSIQTRIAAHPRARKGANDCDKLRLWIRVSSQRSARSSSAAPSPRRPSASGSRSPPSRCRCERSRSGSARSSSTARDAASSRPRPGGACTAARSGSSRSRSRCSPTSSRRRRATSRACSRSAPRPALPPSSCRSSSASSSATHPAVRVALEVHDTRTVVDLVAERQLELGIVGASPRHRGVQFEPFAHDEVVLVCPPGHRFAGQTIPRPRARDETLVVMQEGAGVRRIVDDELRRLGAAAPRPRPAPRARAPGVGAERGARRLRRDVHLARGRRGRARLGRARRGPDRGDGRDARDRPRARDGARPHPRGAGVRRVRARARRRRSGSSSPRRCAEPA